MFSCCSSHPPAPLYHTVSASNLKVKVEEDDDILVKIHKEPPLIDFFSFFFSLSSLGLQR